MQRYIYFFLLVFLGLGLAAQTYSISGQLSDAFDNELGGVSVELLGSDNEVIESQIVGCGDSYSFDGLEEGQSYSIRLQKDDSHFNGISAYDLVLMIRHILGIDYLDNPILVRAADLNDSGSVSVMDMLQMRAWILAITITIPDNQWLFFQETSGTEGPVFPIMLFADQSNYDFTGVKRGDFNSSAAPCQ